MIATDLSSVTLSRPGRAPDAGPLDDRFYDLVEARLRRILRDNPAFATFAGVHTEDGRLGDGSRDALEQEIADDRAHLARIEALDPAALSGEARFERELEIHNVRRSLFDTDVHRVWERRSTAMDGIGDALFAIFARDFAPLSDRLDSLAARMEAVPAYLDGHRTRPRGQQVRLWQTLELESARAIPAFLDEIVEAGRAVVGDAEQRRLERAATTAADAISGYVAWLEESLGSAVDDWALGPERFDELVGLRALDGLDADAILEIGEQELAANRAARA